MKQVFANMGWLLGGRGFNAVLSLVYLAIAARTLGTDGFGHFALIIALGQAVTGFSSFQTWQFIVRWGANPDKPGVDIARAREATGFAVALDIVSMVVGTLASVLLVLTAPLWLDVPTELMWLTFFYCVISLMTIRTTPTGMLRLHSEYGKATWAEAVQPVIRAGGAVLAWWLMPDVTGFIRPADVPQERRPHCAVGGGRARAAGHSCLISAWQHHLGAPQERMVVGALHQHRPVWRCGKAAMILLVGTFGGAYLKADSASPISWVWP